MTTYTDERDSHETAERVVGSEWQLWLDLEADGELDVDERRQLDLAMADHPDLELQRRDVGRLHQLLACSAAAPTIDVRPDFAARVMAGLPSPDWQRRSAGSAAWHLPVAAMLVFATLAAFLLSGLDSVLLGTGAAVADFLATTALAGAGLLEASWRGIGWGLQDLFAESPATVTALSILVLGVDILFVSLLLRRKRQPAAELGRE